MNGLDRRLGVVAGIVLAVLGVPALFYLYVSATYWYASSQGRLPFGVFPDWLWYAVFGACLVVGLMTLRTVSRLRSILVSVLYVAGMTAGLLLVHLWAACANGDCL
jgi:hypothetical protein